MKRGGGVHTVPAANGPGWWNNIDGKVISRHHTKEYAVEAGCEAARRLEVEHTIHLSGGTIGEKNSYRQRPAPAEGLEVERAGNATDGGAWLMGHAPCCITTPATPGAAARRRGVTPWARHV